MKRRDFLGSAAKAAALSAGISPVAAQTPRRNRSAAGPSTQGAQAMQSINHVPISVAVPVGVIAGDPLSFTVQFNQATDAQRYDVLCRKPDGSAFGLGQAPFGDTYFQTTSQNTGNALLNASWTDYTPTIPGRTADFIVVVVNHDAPANKSQSQTVPIISLD